MAQTQGLTMSPVGARVRFAARPAVIVMGVCGCGKSTVAAALAERLGLPFLEADAFHPAANVAKMSAGIPLVDEDRWPWLDALGAAIAAAAESSGGAVATCSALRRAYRDRLVTRIGRPLVFAFLDGPRPLLAERLARRTDHYMPPSLLDSQLATLEQPGPDEPVITLPIAGEVRAMVDALATALAALTPTRAPSPAAT